jgi:hypothetical protein
MKLNHFKFLLLPVFCLIGLFAKAQDSQKPSISIGPDFGIPFNTTNNYVSTRNVYNDGIGVTAKLELPILAGLKFTFTAGYVSYQSKAILSYTPNTPNAETFPGMNYVNEKVYYNFIPVKAGLRYYFVSVIYAEGELGEAIKTNNNSYNSFIYSGGIGLNIPINHHNAIDLGTRYERGYKNYDYDYRMSEFAVRLAYKYQF